MSAWRRADRALEALQQPHGWDAQQRAGDARRCCPIKIHGKQTLQMHLYPPSQHDFCASQQARLDAQSQDDPSGSTSRSRTGERRAGFQDPSGSRGTVAESRAGVLHSKNSESSQLRGAAPRNARESGGRRGQSLRRARASSTAGAAVSRCLAPLQPRRAASVLSVPGAAQEHSTPSTRRNCRNAQQSARDKWLPRQTPPT